MGDPSRPVLAVLGDGSAMYGIQGLWSAAHYGLGVLFILMANARYGVMDAMVSRQGKAPWPGFPEGSLARLAEGFGCPAERVATLGRLEELLDQVMPTLAARSEPLLMDVEVTDEPAGL